MSMPSSLVAAAKMLVGPRSPSSYVNAAVARQLQCDLQEEQQQIQNSDAGPPSVGAQSETE